VPFVRIAHVEQIPRGRTHFLCVQATPLLIANVEGEIFVLAGFCPHRNNPLDGATLIDHLVDCPWHHFQYDVRTGENHFPRNVYPPDLPKLQTQLRPLRKYAVQLREGEIWVNLE
jgi:3-phenylpropionate/trans-cinnamate dioxygenase ferredoxin subunit